MKQLLVIVILAALGWWGYGKYQERVEARAEAAAKEQRARPKTATTTKSGGKDPLFFTCDGRNQCNQMTSCEEARYFLKNCPALANEENREGASCEKQWCR